MKPATLLQIALLFVFSILRVAVQAQPALNLSQMILVKNTDRQLHGDAPAEKFTGSKFLNEEFKPGSVTIGKYVYPNVPMRYNIYDDVIEFTQDGKELLLDPQPKLDKIEFDGLHFVIEAFDFNGKGKMGFLSLLDSGKASLMAKMVIQYTPQQPPKPLEIGPTPAKYIRAQDVYFFKVGNNVRRIESLKKMIADFPDKQEELTAFAKKEKLGTRKKEHLVKLIDYYNSL